MKKKNTGTFESDQGHRAKMNSSDRFGLEEDMAEGWTQVLSKSSKRRLRKDSKEEVRVELARMKLRCLYRLSRTRKLNAKSRNLKRQKPIT
jgi:hypothetical protein